MVYLLVFATAWKSEGRSALSVKRRGVETKSDTVGLWRYIGRAALELGAHAPPAASIAVEKLQASLAPVEGQQDADGSEAWLRGL
jgi:hypothetical protein